MAGDDFSKTFAGVLKKHRVAQKISQEQLAELAGLHPTYISLIERGKRNPSIRVSHRVAGVLKIELSALIKEAESLDKKGGRP